MSKRVQIRVKATAELIEDPETSQIRSLDSSIYSQKSSMSVKDLLRIMPDQQQNYKTTVNGGESPSFSFSFDSSSSIDDLEESMSQSILSLDLETLNLRENYKGNFRVTAAQGGISGNVLTSVILLFIQISQSDQKEEIDYDKIDLVFDDEDTEQLCWELDKGLWCHTQLDEVAC